MISCLSLIIYFRIGLSHQPNNEAVMPETVNPVTMDLNSKPEKEYINMDAVRILYVNCSKHRLTQPVNHS